MLGERLIAITPSSPELCDNIFNLTNLDLKYFVQVLIMKFITQLKHRCSYFRDRFDIKLGILCLHCISQLLFEFSEFFVM